MEYISTVAREITEHALKVIDKLDEEEITKMINAILNAESVFLIGTGRSELVGKAFAMRLMHLGFNVHVIGDATTPAIKKEDCLIGISGSGETKTVTIAAETAKELGTTVVGVTGNPKSTLGKHLDVTIFIDSKTKDTWKHHNPQVLEQVLKGNYRDLTPLGTLFEDTTYLFLDGLIAEFMARLGKKEIDLRKRHAIIEK